MTSITVDEARRDLARWIMRAIAGEQIGIHQDGATVLLQPRPELDPNQDHFDKLTPLEALDRLQARAAITSDQATAFLQEVRAERQAGR